MAKKKKTEETVSEEFVFDTTREIIPVVIDGKNYELREATGEDVCDWQNAILNKAKLDKKGKPVGLTNIADSELHLISLCLFKEAETVGESVETIKAWPSRVTRPLFKKIKEISQLEDLDGSSEEAKNEQDKSQDGS